MRKEAAPAAAAAAAAAAAVEKQKEEKMPKGISHQTENEKRSKLHTYSAEVPVWHIPVEVAEVMFSMSCSVLDGQGKRGHVHIPAIMAVAFPDVVVFDGLI